MGCLILITFFILIFTSCCGFLTNFKQLSLIEYSILQQYCSSSMAIISRTLFCYGIFLKYYLKKEYQTYQIISKFPLPLHVYYAVYTLYIPLYKNCANASLKKSPYKMFSGCFSLISHPDVEGIFKSTWSVRSSRDRWVTWLSRDGLAGRAVCSSRTNDGN